MTFPITKRINAELFINGKQRPYIHRGWIEEIDRISWREALEIVKTHGNENQYDRLFEMNYVWVENENY